MQDASSLLLAIKHVRAVSARQTGLSRCRSSRKYRMPPKKELTQTEEGFRSDRANSLVIQGKAGYWSPVTRVFNTRVFLLGPNARNACLIQPYSLQPPVSSLTRHALRFQFEEILFVPLPNCSPAEDTPPHLTGSEIRPSLGQRSVSTQL
jgi:hypothetical protein